MRSIFDLSTVAKQFRFVAWLEAFTWAALLVGMAFKYIPEPDNDAAVAVVGMVHGIAFMAYVVIAIVAAVKLKWQWWVALLALAASIPPFTTVLFEVWAARSGRLGELSRSDLVAA